MLLKFPHSTPLHAQDLLRSMQLLVPDATRHHSRDVQCLKMSERLGLSQHAVHDASNVLIALAYQHFATKFGIDKEM